MDFFLLQSDHDPSMWNSTVDLEIRFTTHSKDYILGKNAPDSTIVIYFFLLKKKKYL